MKIKKTVFFVTQIDYCFPAISSPITKLLSNVGTISRLCVGSVSKYFFEQLLVDSGTGKLIFSGMNIGINYGSQKFSLSIICLFTHNLPEKSTFLHVLRSEK